MKKYSRHASQEIKIVYRDIGIIDSPMEEVMTALGYQAEDGCQEDTTPAVDSPTEPVTPPTVTEQVFSIPA